MAKLTNIEAQIEKTGFFKFSSLGQFLKNLFDITLALGAIATFIYLIWGGISYIIAGGDQEQLKNAKSKISTSLAGLALLASIWVIWRLITYFFGLSPSASGPFDINLPKP